MPTHPWHDLDAHADRDAGLVHAVIEIPRGGKVKYELDKATGLLRVDRVLYSSVVYPANYGFIPRTFCPDDDPLDVLALCSEPALPLSLMRVRPVGGMRLADEGRQDDKIIAVHVDDPAYADFRDIAELPSHVAREIRRFFSDYKALEGKTIVVEELVGPRDAVEIVREAIALYAERRDELRGATPAA